VTESTTSVFSRIASGELDSVAVESEPYCLSFIPIDPVTPGHVIVASRRQVANWSDLEDPELAAMSAMAKRISAALTELYGAPKVGLLIAGFTVPHAHMHVAPIWESADIAASASADTPMSLEQRVEIGLALREILNRDADGNSLA
jgi:diadenosine tetraphosphate (Ap4A) HIT family hydrolase